MHKASVDRREFVRAAFGVLATAQGGFLLAADCPRTPSNIAGPYWRPGAPFRDRLHAGEPGQAIVVSGHVTGAANCRPLSEVVLDVWQADGKGYYDSDHAGFDPAKFSLRGRVKTDSNGFYQFETVKPAPYGSANSFRPAHIHFRITEPNQEPFVTQLYFAGDPYLKSDPLRQVRDSLVTTPVKKGSALVCRFDVTL